MRRLSYLVCASALVFSIPAISAANTNPPTCAPGQVSTTENPCSAPTPGQPGQPGQPAPQGQPGQPAGSPSSNTAAYTKDPSVIKDARTILRLSEPTSSDNAMVYWDQNQVNFLSFISLEKQGAGGNQTGGRLVCTSPTEKACVDGLADSSFQQIKWDAVTGDCSAREKAACVVSLSVMKADGTTLKATPFKRVYANKSPGWDSTFDAKTNTGYPGADGPWIYRVTDGGETQDYIVLGLVSALFNRPTGASTWDPSEKSLRISIYPVKTTNDDTFAEGSGAAGCIAVEDKFCYQRIAFKTGLRFSLKMRLPKIISGWLNGRLDKPIAYTEAYDDNYFNLIVEADPLEEIVAGKWLPQNSDVKDYLRESKRDQTAAPGQKNMDVAGVDPDDQMAYRSYKKLEKYMDDKALTTSLTWRLNTTSGGSQDFASGCSAIEGVQGIVTSNAAVYEPGSPQWSESEGALLYRVASPHFKEDGKTANVGRYAFAMREDLIKCVYGLKTLPSYASMEITYDESGKSSVASVSLGTKNGWVHLASDNFTYSAPTLKVKLEGWTKSSSTAAGSGSQPAKPGQPNQPAQPNQPNQPNQPAQPNQPGQGLPPCEAGQSPSPAKPCQPAGGNQPNQQVENVIVCQKGNEKVEVKGIKPLCAPGYVMVMANGQPVTQPTPQPAAGQTPAKKITITCVKGKTSKKVTAVQPKCPAGFKIKKA